MLVNKLVTLEFGKNNYQLFTRTFHFLAKSHHISSFIHFKYEVQSELLIEKEEMNIQKLKEYRQSLISEAVTGKMDVRDWKPKK